MYLGCDPQNATACDAPVGEVVISSTARDSPAEDAVDDEGSAEDVVEKKGCKFGRHYFNNDNWTLLGCVKTYPPVMLLAFFECS